MQLPPMSFVARTAAQQSTRHASSNPNPPLPVYLNPGAATRSQAPHQQAPHPLQASYFHSQEVAHPVGNNVQVEERRPNPPSRETPSPSTQLQEHSYLYQLQEAAGPQGPPQHIRNDFQLPLEPRQSHDGSQQPPSGNAPPSQAILDHGHMEDADGEADEPESAVAANVKMDPPPEGSYPTFEALLSAVNAWGVARGYACVIGRSKKKNRIGLKKVLLTCDKGGTSKHTMLPHDSPLRKRATTSRKTGCPFGVYAAETTMEWVLKYRPDPATLVHNHGPSKGAVDHPVARKLDRNAVATVKALRDAGVSAQETLVQLQAAHPGIKFLARDVYNARAALQRDPKTANADVNTIPTEILNSTIYRRATMTVEEKFREDSRAEIAKVREEMEQLRQASSKEIEALKKTLAEKDKLIEKFEMFIDICNGRVMAQREKLSG